MPPGRSASARFRDDVVGCIALVTGLVAQGDADLLWRLIRDDGADGPPIIMLVPTDLTRKQRRKATRAYKFMMHAINALTKGRAAFVSSN